MIHPLWKIWNKREKAASLRLLKYYGTYVFREDAPPEHVSVEPSKLRCANSVYGEDENITYAFYLIRSLLSRKR
jgi:hypothetical protein